MIATTPRPRATLPVSAWLRTLPATVVRSSPATGGEPPPTAERLAMELIDLEALGQLEADTSRELMPRMIEVFCDEATGRVRKILACAAAGDFEGIAAEAHALKSGAGTFGARELQGLARTLEQASEAGDFEVALARAAELESVAKVSLELLREYAVSPR